MEVWNWTPKPKAILKHLVNRPVLKTPGTRMQQTGFPDVSFSLTDNKGEEAIQTGCCIEEEKGVIISLISHISLICQKYSCAINSKQKIAEILLNK